MGRVHQHEAYGAMRPVYPNTKMYNMTVLCKGWVPVIKVINRDCYKPQCTLEYPGLTTINFRTKSLKYLGRYNYELWTIEPSILSIIGYTVIIPVVSALGIIGNSLILAVHLKAKTYLKGSAYTYLAGRWRCRNQSWINVEFTRICRICYCYARRENPP